MLLAGEHHSLVDVGHRYAGFLVEGPQAAVVLAAVLFNWVLCFVNTTLFAVSANLVIGSEMAVIGMALALVWYRGPSLYAILLALTSCRRDVTDPDSSSLVTALAIAEPVGTGPVDAARPESPRSALCTAIGPVR